MQTTLWLPKLDTKISEIENQSYKLSPARAELLGEAASEIAKSIQEKPIVGLNFICTHNSRRSHLSQVWAAVAATYHGIDAIQCFSGGTEATACNPRVVRSLRRAGFSVVTQTPQDPNPLYWLQYAETVQPVELFSKTYDCESNPGGDFYAMMCCDDADQKCPLITGADGRVALHYRDPKESDGTPEEAITYDQRRDEIGAEMFFLARSVKEHAA